MIIISCRYSLENKKKVGYIKKRFQDDMAYDQLNLKKFIDPFTDKLVIKGKLQQINPNRIKWIRIEG